MGVWKVIVMSLFVFFFFNDTATTEIYTLSLHDALPIWAGARCNSDPTGDGLGDGLDQRPPLSDPAAVQIAVRATAGSLDGGCGGGGGEPHLL